MSDVPFFVPTADVHARVVIAPSALSTSHGRPPSSDSRVEARAVEDGNVSKSRLRKPVHELQRLIPLRTTQKVEIAKAQGLRGRSDVDVKPIQSSTVARRLVDVELNDEKRIYGHESSKPTRRKRRLSTTSALDPLKHIKEQQSHAQAQEMALAKALELKMDRVGGRIPVQFLLERQHKAVAERVVLHAMCKVLSRHYHRVLRIAFRYWTRRILVLRLLEGHERQVFLAKQTSLAHACAIIQRKTYKRMSQLFDQWALNVARIIYVEQMASAWRIQRCWRRYIIHHRLRELAMAYRTQVRYQCARLIQSMVRRYLARCEFLRLAALRRRYVAACRIQDCYRNYIVCKIAKRQQLHLKATEIQRCWRGELGRREVCLRRRACRHAVEIVYWELWHGIALRHICELYAFAKRIQRCWWAFQFRQQLAIGMPNAVQRRRFFPAFHVQRAWKHYRARQIKQVIDAVVFQVVMTHLSAVRRIQTCYRQHREIRRGKAARKLVRLFRRFLAKRSAVSRITPWLLYWNCHVLTKWCASLQEISPWREWLTPLKQRINGFSSDQADPIRRYNVRAGLHVIRDCRLCEKNYPIARATAIQHVWRVHRLFQWLAELKRATRVLQRGLPLLFRRYKQRQRRQRVLGRWRRARYITIKERFQHWKEHHLLILEARDLLTTKEKLRKAKWFRHQKLRKRMVRCWQIHTVCEQFKGRQLRKAISLSNQQLKRRVWNHWTHEALPILTITNRLKEIATMLTLWEQWQAFIQRRRQTHKALAHYSRRLRWLAIENWKRDRREFEAELDGAGRHYDARLLSKSFFTLRNYVGRMKRVDVFCMTQRRKRGVRQWTTHMWVAYLRHQQESRGHQFRRSRLIQTSCQQWTRYRKHQQRQRDILALMERHYLRHCTRSTISRWKEQVPGWKDYRFITTLAIEFYQAKMRGFIFREGFAQFWAITVGARRIEMAIRIQRIYRGKRARLLLFAMKTKLQYQLEMRYIKGLDVVTFDPASLLKALETHFWVFVLVSFPWQAIDKKTKEAFQKTATTWQYLRQAPKMLFGYADATEPITVSRSPDDKLSNPEAYSLISWLAIDPAKVPCVVGFWQGVGPCTSSDRVASIRHSPYEPLRRRFGQVCGKEAQPSLLFPLIPSNPVDQTQLTMSTLVNWMDRLCVYALNATTVDLQSYARGFLSRRHVKRLRVLKKASQSQRICQWIEALTRKWRIRKQKDAATKLQRWRKRHVQRRLFWLRLRQELKKYREATARIQSLFRLYINRKRLHLALAAILATPPRYPNAPLCEECYRFDAAEHILRLARLRCRNCSNQAYCADCFLKIHSHGKRMLHVTDTIDVLAMNHVNAVMCLACEVRGATRHCETCNVKSQVACLACFETQHTDFMKMKSGRHETSWWSSVAFQTHNWRRFDGLTSPIDVDPVSTAAAIIEKYEWLTYTKVLEQRESHVLTEQAEKIRQEKLLAIRVQQEAILRDAFDRYDADHSGSIDRTEFKRMFKEELCQPLSDEQVTEALAAMDKSGNGLIEFDELLAWFVEEQLNQQEAGPVNESTSLALLKEALRAKRQMRRYKEKLNEFLPHLPSGGAIADKPQPVARPRVPGFPAVECLEHSDFARKRNVFYRFVHEICNLDWIYEDEAIIPVINAMEVFDQVFLPRWNGGQLTYDYYFDDESFEFEGETWYRRWDAATKKYYFYTTRKKTRTVAIESHKGQKRKKSKSDAHVQVIEEIVEVREAIDPRRKEMLLELARAAFARADADNSGYIDTEEFHRMLNNELCEPVSKSKARQVMKQLDADGSGKIDFNEFFQWYAAEKCQDYPVTAKMERARALLKTKQRAKATARAAVDASVAGSTKLKDVIDRKMKEHQLARDCKGAPAELITLLEEGFPKGLAEKALALHNQEVIFARQWLQDKQQEEQHKRETVARERANRKAQAKKDARTRSLKRRQKMVAMRKQVKLVLFGLSKKEAHAARVDQALMNLDREIKLVERQMTTKFR